MCVAVLDARVAGIPCKVQVDYFHHKPADPNSWASDLDYYGYTDIEFSLLDRRGRAAPWLERKLDKAEKERIEELIVLSMPS